MSERIEKEGPMTMDFNASLFGGGLPAVNARGPFGIRFLILAASANEAKVRCEVVDSNGKTLRVLHGGAWIYVGSKGDGFTIENIADCFKVVVQNG